MRNDEKKKDAGHSYMKGNEETATGKVPAVSVVIPVFNSENYLRECLDSILSQTLTEIEVLCVDDGSTDSSHAILKEYANRDKRVKVYRQENAGAGVARNLGLSHATGEFLFFADSDDFFEPDLLEICAETAIHEQSDIVIFSANNYNSETKEFMSKKRGLILDYCPDYSPFRPEEMKDYIFLAFQNWTWNKFFRHAFIQRHEIKFQNVARSNDVAFVMNALAVAEKISIADRVLSHYRVKSGDSLQQTRYMAPLAFFDAYREAKRRLIEAGVYKTFERSYLNKLLTMIRYNIKTDKSVSARENIISFLRYCGEAEFGLTRHSKEYYFKTRHTDYYLNCLGDGFEFSPIAVSVIIPVYNAEKYLRQTLNSVLSQSLKRIEVICVDVGSTDASREIVTEYAENDDRVKLICRENQHAGVARNNGLCEAVGEYVHFLNADDFVLNYAYESIYNKAKRNDLDCLKFCAIAFDEKNQVTVDNPLYRLTFFADSDFMRPLSCENDEIIYKLSRTPWTGLFRREFLIENNILFNNLFCVNDRSFYAHLISLSPRLMVSRDRLVVNRVNMESSLVGKRIEHFDCQMESVQIIQNQLSESGCSSKAADQIMKCELEELVSWCRKFSGDDVYGDRIVSQTEDFLHHLSYDFIDDYISKVNEIKENREEIRERYKNTPPDSLVKTPPVDLFYDGLEKAILSVFIVIAKQGDAMDHILNTLTNIPYRQVAFHIIQNEKNNKKKTDSLSVIKEFADVDKRIRLISTGKLSPEKLLDRALKAAKGQYIMFVKSDHYTSLNKLETLLARISDNQVNDMKTESFILIRNTKQPKTGSTEIMEYLV